MKKRLYVAGALLFMMSYLTSCIVAEPGYGRGYYHHHYEHHHYGGHYHHGGRW